MVTDCNFFPHGGGGNPKCFSSSLERQFELSVGLDEVSGPVTNVIKLFMAVSYDFS
jgi:hypothetical protein